MSYMSDSKPFAQEYHCHRYDLCFASVCSIHNSSALSVSVDANVELMSVVAFDDDAAAGVALAPPTDT